MTSSSIFRVLLAISQVGEIRTQVVGWPAHAQQNQQEGDLGQSAYPRKFAVWVSPAQLVAAYQAFRSS
ncbi:hypothetical protein WJX74_008917 [Apatococcus lobatus]|uniref:Uncharacterized protein n=1 Tax=Apatococcus lobatus TaxID=904363 RepID=A0AAW1RXD0_9CHLO